MSGVPMRRRDVITLLGGVAALPRVARAQQPTMPVVGFLSTRSASDSAQFTAAFHRGLNEIGYVEGRNYILDFRWGEGRNDRLTELAAELVRAHADVIVTAGEPAIRAARQATTTIPIVMGAVGDPVGAGFAASLASGKRRKQQHEQ